MPACFAATEPTEMSVWCWRIPFESAAVEIPFGDVTCHVRKFISPLTSTAIQSLRQCQKILAAFCMVMRLMEITR